MDYREIFMHRGKAYHNAMLRQPSARDHEFERLFDACRPSTGQRLLDFPSGGGYLQRHLAAGVTVQNLELSSGFDTGVPVCDAAANINSGPFDHIVCLAALHHIDDQAGFLERLLGQLRPGGTLHVGDVAAGSRIDAFLDGFIGRYNQTGHQGSYLRNDPAWFERIGRVTRIGELSCPWVFESEAQMLDFCNDLFGLVDCPRQALRDALSSHVGFHRQGSQILLEWRLLYADLQT